MLCGRVTNLLSAYIDRELAGVEMLEVREHLIGCEACRREHTQLTQIKSLLGRMPAATPRGEYVAATVRRWQMTPERLSAPRSPGFRAWRLRLSLWKPFEVGQPLRAVALSACLLVALVATGVALRQPSNADAVVARLPRAELDDWRQRPWELFSGHTAARRGFWIQARHALPASEQPWLLFSLSHPTGSGRSEDSAVRLVREIAHRQPIGLTWALD